MEKVKEYVESLSRVNMMIQPVQDMHGFVIISNDPKHLEGFEKGAKDFANRNGLKVIVEEQPRGWLILFKKSFST